LYYAFIYSHLTFGVLIWGATPKTYLQKLQWIQNKAVRLLAGANWQDHTPPIYTQLNILNLDKLANYTTAKFMHRYYLKKIT